MVRADDPDQNSTRTFSTEQSLLDSSGAWNLLWERSQSARPTSRADFIAKWAQHFASPAALRAVVVESGSASAQRPAAKEASGEHALLAALPLIESRLPLGIRVGSNPFSHWASAGEFLLDPAAEPETVDRLVEAVRTLGLPLLRLRGVPLSADAYKELEASCRRLGLATYSHVTHDVGMVELGSDYSTYMAGRSKNHRAHMRKAARRAEREGGVSLRIVSEGDSRELAEYVRSGFEVERSSWKGRRGSAVLDVPEIYRFFESQAQLLSDAASLHLVFLEHQGKPIAFEYGYLSQGHYFTPKVGYDESFAHLSPGQLLRAKLFEHFCGQTDAPRVDFDGPLAAATAKWCSSTYPVGNLLVALDRPRGASLLWAYRKIQQQKQRRREKRASRA